MSEEKNAVVKHAGEYSLSEIGQMAQAFAKSGLFGMKTTEEALALMLVAQAEGLHPATAARDYHIIQGRPALKADAMLARFQKSGGVVAWQEVSDKRVAAEFHHPQSSPKPVLIEWTIEMAVKAGLTVKEIWKKYPRAMLRSRVISEGIRTCYPACNVDVYTPEEIHDMPAEPRNVTAEVTVEPPKERTSALVDKLKGKTAPAKTDDEIRAEMCLAGPPPDAATNDKAAEEAGLKTPEPPKDVTVADCTAFIEANKMGADIVNSLKSMAGIERKMAKFTPADCVTWMAAARNYVEGQKNGKA
jgi:hypothetical protein